MLASRSAAAQTPVTLSRPSRVTRASRASRSVTRAASSIHDFSLQHLGAGTRDAPTEGAAMPLSAFKGKVVLINNIATM